MRRLFPGLLLLLLVAVPVTAQQPVDGCNRQCSPRDADVNDPPLRTEGPVNVILYAHYQDILNRAPLTLQPPSQHEPDVKGGFLMPTLITRTGTPADVNFDNANFLMQPCPGPVHIQNGRWQNYCHVWRFTDLHLAEPTVTLYWYLSAETGFASPTGSSLEPGVGAMPHVGVRASMHAGPKPLSQNIIGHGDTGPGAATLLTHPLTGEEVYEFQVAIRMQSSIIEGLGEIHGDGLGGFLVVVQPYQVEAGETVQVMQNEWRARTGPDYLPRLVLPLANPLEWHGAQTRRVQDGLSVLTTVGTPLGSYDLVPETLRLTVTSPSRPDLPEPVLVDLRHRPYDHDAVLRPTQVLWFLNLTHHDEPLDLVFNLSVENTQGTYRLERTFVAAWTPLQGENLPALSPALLLATLALALLVHARRRPA